MNIINYFSFNINLEVPNVYSIKGPFTIFFLKRDFEINK